MPNIVEEKLGGRVFTYGTQITDTGGTKQLKYNLQGLRDTLADFDVTSITVIDPTNKSTFPDGNTLATTATVQKAWLYVELKDSSKLLNFRSLEDLFYNVNTPPIILDDSVKDNINWTNSFIAWGVAGDIADADVGNYVYLQIFYKNKE